MAPIDRQPRPAGTGAAALLAGVALYSVALAFVCRALDEAAIRSALRLQARLSFALFVLPLAARALFALAGGAVLGWMARHRSSLFRAFVVSHLVHGVWVLLFFARTPATFIWGVVDVSGALTFPIIALLLLPLERLLGARAMLVRRGVIAYVWVQFTGFFVDRLYVGRPELKGWYAAAIDICIVSAVLAALGERRVARGGTAA